MPTCLLYNDQGQVLAWGLEAKNASPMPGTIRTEWLASIQHLSKNVLILEIGLSCSWNRMHSETRQPLTLDCLNCLCVKLANRYIFVLITEPLTQPGKQALDLIIDFLSCLWEYAKEQITREIGAVADLSNLYLSAIL